MCGFRLLENNLFILLETELLHLNRNTCQSTGQLHRYTIGNVSVLNRTGSETVNGEKILVDLLNHGRLFLGCRGDLSCHISNCIDGIYNHF